MVEKKRNTGNAYNPRIRLFVDLDGTLCKWKAVEQFEELLEKDFFLNMEENPSVVEGIREIITNHPDIEVYSLSATLEENPYAIEEKNLWLDAHLPELDDGHRLFSRCGSPKTGIVPDGVRQTDVLMDDYTRNLLDWSKAGKGLKLCNGVNDTHKTWQGTRVYADQKGNELAKVILSFCVAD